MKPQHLFTILTAVMGLLSAIHCHGVAYTFNVTSGDWGAAGNWSPSGVPVAADTVTIPTGRTVTGLGGANRACTSITIQGTGRLFVDANTLTVSGAVTVGSSGAANLTIESGGTLNITGTTAWGFGGTGSSITNNGIFICNAGNSTTPGIFVNNGTATFTGTGQSFNNNGSIIQGPNAVLNLNANVSTPIGASPTKLFTNAGNTVSFGAAGDVNTTSGTYQILAFTNSGRRSMQSPTVVSNKLSIRGNVNDVRFGTSATYGPGATLEYKSAVAQTLGNTADAFPTTAGPAHLIIDNPSGFTLSSSRTITGRVELVSGTFSSANNLTLGAGATVIRGAGSFSGTPVFGSSVNVIYNGTSATTTGTELPTTASVLSNLTLSNLAGVNLNANATVNGTFTALYASGTPALAVGTRTLALGSAPIALHVSGAPLAPGNYTIVSKTSGGVTATPGTLTINGNSAPFPAPYTGATISAATGALILNVPASSVPTSVAVTSSANPAGYLSAVELVAEVSPATATGTVQFKTNGVALGAPVALDLDATATLTTSSLLRGTHVVTAEYSGDSGHDPSTGTLSPNQVITNHPPVALDLTLGGQGGVPSVLKVIGGKHPPTDVDGDALWVSAVSTPANGTAATDGTNVTYIANAGHVGADSFTYTVSDGFGGTSTAAVNVTVLAATGYNQLSIESLGGGTVRLNYLGIPGLLYALDWRTNLTAGDWLPVITNAAATNGALVFTNTSGEPFNFYRTRHVPAP